MQTATKENTSSLKTQKPSLPLNGKAARQLADSVYSTLINEGCSEKDIIGISSQLISIVTENLELSE